jgi:hypothetical protein
MATWNILRIFGIFYDHLVHFMFVWYIFSGFGNTREDKSGNPVAQLSYQSKLLLVTKFEASDLLK